MLNHSRRLTWLSPAFACLLTQTATAQCLEWDDGFAGTGVGGVVHTMLRYDDGSGEAVYVAGNFDWVSGTAASDVARWDGSSWSSMGTGISGNVYALAGYDDGSGPSLYAGGKFALNGVTNVDIARWDGSSWVTAMPALNGDEVQEMTVFDDGTGPALYVASNTGTAFTGWVYEWDGSVLTQVGALPKHVEALEVYDHGGGDKLYAAVRPNGNTWQIVEWQGGTTWNNWEFVQGGAQTAYELCVHDPGNGERLVVAGDFSFVSGVPAQGVAAFGPINWASLGNGLSGQVNALLSHDDGSGRALYAGGSITGSGAVALQNFARWDGVGWSNIGDMNGIVNAVNEDSAGNLLAGGSFVRVDGDVVNGIARWDGADWSALGSGLGFSDSVLNFAVFDDGNGPALYASGDFRDAGLDRVDRLARWNGSGWDAVGGGLDGSVEALQVYDDGTGEALYVGGNFTLAGGLPAARVARWDGTSWAALGGGFNKRVNDLTVADLGQGPELFAGGEFTGRIGRWTGSGWSVISSPPLNPVSEVLGWDDGSGPALFVAGPLTQVGSLAVNGVAKWDGTSWSALGNGLGPFNRQVHDLVVLDTGNGPQLYACGDFTKSGTETVSRVARWDGTSWSQVGTGSVNNMARSLAVHDDGSGSGPSLYMTGDFTAIGGATIHRLARLDGTTWTAVGSGLDAPGRALFSYDDGGGQGPSLWMGGDFDESNAVQASHVARLSNACPQVGVNYCTAGTSASGCQAVMSASGTPSATAPTGFFFHVNGLEGQKTGLFLWAANGRQANSWGNGTSYICVVPPRYRSAVLGPSGTPGLCDGSESADMNARWTLKPNSNPGAGALTQAQFWYRDPQNTSNQTSGLSDGLEFTVGP